MAITLVSSGSAAGSAASFSPTPTAGNLLVVGLLNFSASSISSAPAGWSVLNALASGGSGVNARALVTYYKIAGSTESSGPSWTWASANSTMIVWAEYAGVSTSSPIDANPGAALTTGEPRTTPAATATAGERLVVMIHGVRTTTATWSSESVTGGAAVTERVDSTAGGTAMSGLLCDAIFTATASSYTGQATSTSPTDNGASAIAIFQAQGVTTAYKDVTARVRLFVRRYADATIRFALRSPMLKDATVRLALRGLRYKDVTVRTGLAVLKDTGVTARTNIALALGQAYKDATMLAKMAAGSYRDSSIRYISAFRGYRDGTIRVTPQSTGYRDATARFKVVSADASGQVIVLIETAYNDESDQGLSETVVTATNRTEYGPKHV